VYYIASRKLEILVRLAVPLGLAYGALVYFFMHLVVVPLSAASIGHAPLLYQVAEFVEHWFCVGLPIALSISSLFPLKLDVIRQPRFVGTAALGPLASLFKSAILRPSPAPPIAWSRVHLEGSGWYREQSRALRRSV